jgi:hypothetical protein
MRSNEYTKGFKYRMHRFFCQYQLHFYTVGVDLRNAAPMLSVRRNIGGMTHTNESPIFPGRFSFMISKASFSSGMLDFSTYIFRK